MSQLIPDACPDWQTALLLPVPAAEVAVGEHRARLDEAAWDGVPAHVTILYPFVPAAEADEALLVALCPLFAGHEAFGFTLDKAELAGDRIAWLSILDPAPFLALTDAVFSAFPAYPPFGGRHAKLVPHLTIGNGDDRQELAAAVDAVRPCLPITAVATEVILMAGPRPGNPDSQPGQWRTVAAFPLG